MKDKEKQFRQECSLIANGEDLPTDKQIEEMARAMCWNSMEWTCRACNWGVVPDCDSYKTAVKLFDNGYRKIPDGAVVLTEEQMDMLVSRPYHEDQVKKVRKKTAEKIFKKIFALHGNRADIMYFEIEELAKQFGVKV